MAVQQQYGLNVFTDDTVFECKKLSVFLKSNNKSYKPRTNHDSFTLTFVNEMDDVIVETASGATIYRFDLFVDLKDDWMTIEHMQDIYSIGSNTNKNCTSSRYFCLFISAVLELICL
jgi:hypothetical protein